MKSDQLIVKYSEIKNSFFTKKLKADTHFTLYEIFYEHSPQLLLTISPPLELAKPPLPIDKNQSVQSLSFSIRPSHTQNSFIQALNNIDHHFSQHYPDYDWVPTVKRQPDHPTLKPKLPLNRTLEIYDQQGQKQTLDFLVPPATTSILLYLKYLWVNHQERLAGLSWYILQAKVQPGFPILSGCLIPNNEPICPTCGRQTTNPPTDSHSSEPQKSSLPPPYQKYLKMIKLGIPAPAIFQKCQLDGLDIQVLQQDSHFAVSTHLTSSSTFPIMLLPQKNTLPQMAPPPPPPPSASGAMVVKKKSSFKVSNDLLQQGLAKLSTPKISTSQTLIKNPTIDPRVPSLGMILGKLKTLKRTASLMRQINHFPTYK